MRRRVVRQDDGRNDQDAILTFFAENRVAEMSVPWERSVVVQQICDLLFSSDERVCCNSSDRFAFVPGSYLESAEPCLSLAPVPPTSKILPPALLILSAMRDHVL
jgi:hypothetical protein